ncbi:MAG TPA: tyrosine-type recombinase/integrase [bacterium]|nr:tyrosine-type recombinase/integrase [bacterium]
MPGRRHLRSPIPSVDPLLLEWWTDLEGADRGLNTRLAYIRDLKDFSEYIHGKLEDARTEDLVQFARRMTEAGLSVATRARRITALRQFYEWLRKRQGRPYSIGQDIHPPRRPYRVHRWWTEDQVAQFRSAFREGSPRVLRDRAMAELGLMGLRVSEVTRLDIERVVNLADAERAALVVLRKGNKEQVVPLTDDARAALLAWLAVRPTAPTTALFFRLPFQPRRARLHYASVEKIFKRYAGVAGVPIPEGIAFHHLRHTAGQQMATVGLGIEEAQRLLGHANPATTQVYYEVTDARLRNAAHRLRYRGRAQTPTPPPHTPAVLSRRRQPPRERPEPPSAPHRRPA